MSDNFSNNSNKAVAPSGIGFSGLLTLIFITLKLCGVINWSWIWVFSPMWINAALSTTIVVIMLIIKALFNILSEKH